MKEKRRKTGNIGKKSDIVGGALISFAGIINEAPLPVPPLVFITTILLRLCYWRTLSLARYARDPRAIFSFRRGPGQCRFNNPVLKVTAPAYKKLLQRGAEGGGGDGRRVMFPPRARRTAMKSESLAIIRQLKSPLKSFARSESQVPKRVASRCSAEKIRHYSFSISVLYYQAFFRPIVPL